MRLFLFRGLAGRIFSRGMDQLSIKLNNAGHISTVHSWIERKTVQRQVLDEFRNDGLRKKVGLIGHSLGGNSANFMAIKLIEAGIDIAYIATIDPTEPRTTPTSVHADNFRSKDIRAEKVKGANDYYYPNLSHIQIDKYNQIHQHIIDTCANTSCKSSNFNQKLPLLREKKLGELPSHEILRLFTALLQRPL